LNYALDACAMIAYLKGEPGALVVAGLLGDPKNRCFAHAINMCEVYYGILRATDESTARAALSTLHSDRVIVRRDMNQQFWRRVGNYKARGRISIPDCFCIVLAQQLGGEVVTSDHHEFDPLVPLGIVPIRFIR
jgi:predicted nucleic acid-binding protein